MGGAGNALDEQRHLFVLAEQAALSAIGEGILAHGAGVDRAHGEKLRARDHAGVNTEALPSQLALRGRCDTTSEAPFDSKSGTQFLLLVDCHGVGSFARHPVDRHGMAAQQTHTQRLDVFGVSARVGIDGAA